MESKISTVDLKALYDFSVLHAEILTQTGNNHDVKLACHNRDRLYSELVKRVGNESMKLVLYKD